MMKSVQIKLASSFSPIFRTTHVVAPDRFNIQFGRLLKTSELSKYRKLSMNNNQHSLRKQKLMSNGAAPEYSDEINEQDSPAAAINYRKTLLDAFDLFHRFTRFFTLKGAVLAALSSSFLAVQSFSDFTPSFFRELLLVLISVFFANTFVMSLNQVTDLEIDRINKPHLPMVTGEVSVKSGILFCALSVVMGLSIALYVPSWPIRLCLFLWYALGIAYSVDLPLLRWKANPFLAVLAIWGLRGLLIPIFYYLHTQVYVFGRPALFPKHVIFSTLFLTLFYIVIPIFKDLPDVEGDLRYGIKTFPVRFGQARIFWMCIWLLEIAYGMAIFVGLSSTHFWVRSLMVTSHMILGSVLWKKANMVDLNSKKELHSLDMFIWELCCVEYFLLPVLRF